MKRWMPLGETGPGDESDTQCERLFQPIVAGGVVAPFEELKLARTATQIALQQLQSAGQPEEQLRNPDSRSDTCNHDANAAIVSELRGDAERLRAALVDQERDLKLSFETRIRHLESQQLQLIHEQLSGMRTAIVDVLSSKTADVLRPVLSNAFLERTLGKYRLLISEFIASELVLPIKIKGPAELASGMEDLIGNNAAVTLHPGTAAEIVLEAGKAVITSKLTEWANSLAGVHELE
ncbi:MAG: hypothetical protein WCC66_10140 [Rhizobiaceae bacterium]